MVRSRVAAAYDSPVEIEPATALLLEVHRASAICTAYAAELSELDDVTSREGQLLTSTYYKERELLVRVAKLALDAGVAEREVRVAESQGQLIAQVIVAALHEMDLSPAQFSVAKRIVATKLRELGSGESRSIDIA